MNDVSNQTAAIHWAARADNAAITEHLAAIINAPGDHWLAVPGGQTPLPIFAHLSHQDLPWNRISLLLTDDRMVAQDHPASNQGKLVNAFGSTTAHIAPLDPAMDLPRFDLVWLGMGNDGHIASLFPNIDATAEGEPAVIEVTPDPLPPEAPFKRLSLNLAALINSRQIMLVIRGEDKKEIIEAAIAGSNDLPIARLIKAANCPITIFWSAT